MSSKDSRSAESANHAATMRCSVKRGGLPQGGLRSENAGKPLAGEEIKMADLGIDKEDVAAAKKGPGRPKKDAAPKKEKS